MRMLSIILSLIFAVGINISVSAKSYEKVIDVKSVNSTCSIENKNDDCCERSSKAENSKNDTDCCDDECDGLMICCIQLNVIAEKNQISTPTPQFLNQKKYFNYSSFHLSNFLNEILQPPKLYNI